MKIENKINLQMIRFLIVVNKLSNFLTVEEQNFKL